MSKPYPKQAVTESLKDMIETFGGTKYQAFTLEAMKDIIKSKAEATIKNFHEDTGDNLVHTPFGKAFDMKMKMCQRKMSKESLLTSLTETYLAVTE